MSRDILNYPDLVNIERQLLEDESQQNLGRFYQGVDESVRIGDGLEIDGLREYMPGDDARHIDWLRTMSQPDDGTLLVRQHFAEQAPYTVLISDIPNTSIYAETMGQPLSSMYLGFVAGHLAMRTAVRSGSPVIGLWTDGYKFEGHNRKAHKGNKAPKIVTENGLLLAQRSIEFELAMATTNEKKGIFRRKVQPELDVPETEDFSDVISRSVNISARYTDAAKFIIISDFRRDTDAVVQQMKKIKRGSEVVAIQITNPLLRELPDGVTKFTGSQGRGQIIDSDGQRELYRAKAAAKQAEIDEKLKSSTSKVITLDTMDPRLLVVATA